MQNKIESETGKKDPFLFKHEDIRGGITVDAAELGAAVEIEAGTPVGKDSNGLYHVIKAAKLYENEANTETAYKVLKGHGFEVGDIITGDGTAVKGYDITAIDTSNAAYDIVTVSTTLGVALNAGDALYQIAAEDATGGAGELTYTPVGLLVSGLDIVEGGNHSTGCVVRGTIQEDLLSIPIPSQVKAALPLILFV